MPSAWAPSVHRVRWGGSGFDRWKGVSIQPSPTGASAALCSSSTAVARDSSAGHRDDPGSARWRLTNPVVTTDTAAFVPPLAAPKVLPYGEVSDRPLPRGPASIEDGHPMREGARVQTREGMYGSWQQDRIRVDLALAPQGWEPVEMSRAPKALTTSDAFQARGWRPPSQQSVPMSGSSDHREAWATAGDLQLAVSAVVSLLLGAVIVVVLVLAYLADTQ